MNKCKVYKTVHLECIVLLPENWVCLLVGVKPTDITKPEMRRRKDLLLFAAIKENTKDLSQSNVCPSITTGDILSSGYLPLHEGFEQRRARI